MILQNCFLVGMELDNYLMYLIYQEGATLGWSGTLVSLGLSRHLALGWPCGEHVWGNR